MVDESQVPPFVEWLLGAQWREGVVFQWLLLNGWGLLVFALVAVALAAGLVFAMRRGSMLAARLVGWSPLVLLILAAVALGTVWAVDPERTAEGSPLLESLLVGGLGGQWWQGALVQFLLVSVSLASVVLVVVLLGAAVRHGPLAGPRRMDRVLAGGLTDLASMSPRRVAALAALAVKESIRRRVLVAFAVFILVLLFAGWFLDPGSTHPARLYMGFVLTATSYLVLVLMLFLSVFSLPADLRTRTLHTVVTKPVRPSEIVFGRILGFAIIGTGLLAVMGAISYVFVIRGLDHTHELTVEDFGLVARAEGGDAGTRSARTSRSQGHRHDVVISSSGETRVEISRGHWHSLQIDESEGQTRYALGPPEGALLARVPVYGKLVFRTRDGVDTEQGINVGDEWTYRSFIEGGSQAAAIWAFQDMRPERFPESMLVEMNIGVFRTHKGDMEKGVLGSLAVRNPKTGLSVEVEIFESKEFTSKQVTIPRKIDKFSSAQVISRRVGTSEGVVLDPPPERTDPSLAEKTEFDLYEDLTDDGRMEIWLRCLEPKQYFGAAQPDLYLRATDASFTLNFAKGYFGIWLQMLLLIGLGVMFSTFLSGAVAMIATMGVLLGGFFGDFMQRLAMGETYGGGPIESLIRMVNQQNVMSELNPGLGGEVAKMLDFLLGYFLMSAAALLPRFGEFSFATHVAYGFNVSWDLLFVRFVGALAFLVPVFVIGFFFLKTREVAR